MHGPWLRPVLATAFVVTALVVAFLLFDHTDLGRQIFGQLSHARSARVQVEVLLQPATDSSSVARLFDPDGSGHPARTTCAAAGHRRPVQHRVDRTRQRSALRQPQAGRRADQRLRRPRRSGCSTSPRPPRVGVTIVMRWPRRPDPPPSRSGPTRRPAHRHRGKPCLFTCTATPPVTCPHHPSRPLPLLCAVDPPTHRPTAHQRRANARPPAVHC